MDLQTRFSNLQKTLKNRDATIEKLRSEKAELEREKAGWERKEAELVARIKELSLTEEPKRKEAKLMSSKAVIEPERVAYLYHFYDPVAKRFVNTGHSEMFGALMREYRHVNDSKKSTTNTKLKEINRLMNANGTGLHIFRSKIQLTKEEAVNFEGCFLLADGDGGNINQGSFRGEFATYNDDQKRVIGQQLIAEALACITDNMTLYKYSNFKKYNPKNICRKGTCKGFCKRENVELWVAGYCRSCQPQYWASVRKLGKCEGQVKNENGDVLFRGCGQIKPLKNKSAKFCISCNQRANEWKNRDVCKGPSGIGCTNSNSSDKSAIVSIKRLTPNKMCNACCWVYDQVKKPSKKK